jgi:hypothetical protein
MVVVVLNQDGSIKATAPFVYTPSSSSANTPALTTIDAHRQMILALHCENRAAGLCSEVMIYENGYVESAACEQAAPPARLQLSASAVKQLHAWKKTYRSFEFEQAKGTGENRVTTRISFVGNGSREISDSEARAIQMLLDTLLPAP